MNTSRQLYSFLFLFFAVCSLSGQVTINEVLFDPFDADGQSTAGEWVELYATDSVNLGCHILTDGDWVLTVPPGTSLLPGQTFVIGYQGSDPSNGANTGEDPGTSIAVDLDISTCDCIFGTGFLNLTNGGEFLALFDSAGNFLEGVQYGAPSAANSPVNVDNNIDAGQIGPCNPTDTLFPLQVSQNVANFASIEDVDVGFFRLPDGTGNFVSASDRDAMTPGNTNGEPDTCAAQRDLINISQTTCDSSLVGIRVDSLVNEAGCDSVVITTTTLAPNDTTIIEGTTCDSTLSGESQVILTNAAGCDSVVITRNILATSEPTLLEAVTCDSAQVGVSRDTLQNVAGCDSVVILTTTLAPADTIQAVESTCDPSEAGQTEEFIVDAEGCSTLVQTTITLLPSDTTIVELTTCDSSLAGVQVDTLVNAGGCDSLVITTRVFAPSDITLIESITCDTTLVGERRDTLMNQAGCDSVVITALTLAPIDTLIADGVTCDPSEAGLFGELVFDPEGCRVFVITGIELLPPDTTFLEAKTCDSTEIGTTDTLFVNRFGCDSLIITETVLDIGTDSTSSECDNTSVSSLESLLTQLEVELAPNPFAHHFSIRIMGESFVSGSLQIRNSLGQVVAQPAIKRGEVLILGDSWPAGLYYISLWDQGPFPLGAVSKY